MMYVDFEQLPLVLTVWQVAEVLGISKNTAYELVRCGEIGSVRVGRQIRVPKEAVKKFLAA